MTSFATHVLASDRASIQVIPELGGRVSSLTDLRSGREWMWRNNRVPIGPADRGAGYDESWQGGFEELFPSDAPTTIGGLDLPDHGELWSTPWTLDDLTRSSASLSVVGPVTGVAVRKQLELTGSTLTIRYELRHNGETELPHLFKLHPAVAVDEHCRIELPGGSVQKVDPKVGNLLSADDPQLWPTSADLSVCRDRTSNTNEFVYVSELPAGWCAITDTRIGSSLRMRFPMDVFPYCWIFMTYGGWHGHNVVVLEPCTNYPKDLHEAMSSGTCGVLAPGETREFAVSVSVG